MKRFLSGFLAGTLLLGSIGVVGAAALTKKIEVSYNVGDVRINGRSMMPSNSNMQPFIYNGTTFVPLRFISENLDYRVRWDQYGRTIYIDELETKKTPTDAEIKKIIEEEVKQEVEKIKRDMERERERERERQQREEEERRNSTIYPGDGIDYFDLLASNKNTNKVEIKYADRQGIRDNEGNLYRNYIKLALQHEQNKNTDAKNPKESWLEVKFPTLRDFYRFEATLALTEKYKGYQFPITFKIFADGKEVYKRTVEAGDSPKEISLNIRDVRTLTFYVSVRETWKKRNEGSNNLEIGLFDARFLR